MERLSTGKRINSANDDAAGVAIASRLSSEIRGTNQAIRNAQDGQALINTAEGAHKEIENILQRMRVLAVQAANDTNDGIDRGNLDAEMQQLVTEIDRISSVTTWAGQSLLDGSNTNGFNFQIGGRTNTGDSLNVLINSVSAAALGVSGAGGGTTGSAASAISDSTFAASFADSTLSITAAATGQEAVSAQDATVAVSEVQSFDVSAGVSDAKVYTMTIGSVELSGTPATADAAGLLAALQADADYSSSGITLTANGNTIVASFAATGDQPAITLETGGDTIGTATGTGPADITVAASTAATTAGDGFDLTVGGVTLSTGAGTYADTDAIVTALKSDTNYANSGFTIAANSTNIVVTPNNTGSITATLTNTVATVVTATETTPGADAQGVVTAQPAVTNEVLTVTLGSNSFEVDLDTATYTTENQQASAIAAALNADATFTGQYGATAIGSTIVFSGLGDTFNVNSRDNALAAIDAVDTAIQTVNTQRANLGAYSNRLDNTVSNLTNISINLEGGKGRIEDADFAAESTSLAKSQILQQASTAMLAQANASKQNVLSLLQG